MSKPFEKLSEKQEQLFALIRGPAPYILGLGGSRSGKTFGFTLAIIQRAIAAPGSRHGVFRNTLTACIQTLFDLSFPEVFEKVYPGYLAQCKVNISAHTIELPNGSVILFGGLDDNDRVEKILGQEFLTVYVNEISQINGFKPIGLLMTRLSQSCVTLAGKPARHKLFLDCNPPTSRHWAYKAFVEGLRPGGNDPLPKPENWVSILMNPIDNAKNLPPDYIDGLQNLSARERQRMIDGLWQVDVDGALFKFDWIDDQRIEELKGDLVRIIVAVDPAVSSNPGSDETGIIVAGIDADGHGFVLDDRSVKGTPERWARAVADAYRDWHADLVVYEKNQGGEMVETTLRSAGVNLPTKAVWASRGKVIRAEPISLLYEKGKVSHVGTFGDLEDQMANFTLDFNRAKQGSPDRLDALVWALSELMTEEVYQPGTVEVATVKGFWG